MSAKKFGGQYSPGGHGTAAPSAPRPDRQPNKVRADFAAGLLFLLPTPLLFSAIGSLMGGAVFGAGVDLLAYACLMLGAWLVREGQKAEAAYHAREIAKPPALPRKLAAAAMAAAGVGLATWLGWGQGLFTALGFAALAGGAHVLAFGLDPMKSKGIETHGVLGEQAAEALDTARERLENIERMSGGLGDGEITGRVGKLMGAVREMLSMIERDPRDLSRARRYLTVYLKSAEDATQKYAAARKAGIGEDQRDAYLGLIAELEASYDRGREMLLADDKIDLEVEIEVLRERLQQESR